MFNDMSFYHCGQYQMHGRESRRCTAVGRCLLLQHLEHTQLTPQPPWWHPHPRARCQPSSCQWVASNMRGAPCCTPLLRSRWARPPCASGKIKKLGCTNTMVWCILLCGLAMFVFLGSNKSVVWHKSKQCLLTNASWLESKCMAISFSSKLSYQFGIWQIDRTLSKKLFSELKILLCHNLHTWNANVFNRVPIKKNKRQDETWTWFWHRTATPSLPRNCPSGGRTKKYLMSRFPARLAWKRQQLTKKNQLNCSDEKQRLMKSSVVSASCQCCRRQQTDSYHWHIKETNEFGTTVP